MRSPLPSSPPPSGPTKRQGAGSSRWPWVLVAALTIAALIAFLMSEFPGQLGGDDSQIRLVHGLLWLAVIGSALILNWRLRPVMALKYAAVWLVIAGVLLVGYSFRFEAAQIGDRILAELLPDRGRTDGDEVVLLARRGGHFAVQVDVDGTPLRFLVDTGATDVVLSPADAQRLGIDLKTLNFNRRYATANGFVFGAPITLRHMTIGPITLRNVRASVNSAPLRESLLGMSFLSRLSSYRVEGGRLILRR